MSLPSVERTAGGWPASTDATSSGAVRVIPVAPVNPIATPSPPLVPSPSVVNHVSAAAMLGTMPSTPNEGQPVYTSVPDPVKNSASTQQVPHDWTLHTPSPEKVDAQPSKAVSQALMDNLKTMWTASASAVQIEQVKNQVSVPDPALKPAMNGVVAQQAVTYQPTKIPKTGKI